MLGLCRKAEAATFFLQRRIKNCVAMFPSWKNSSRHAVPTLRCLFTSRISECGARVPKGNRMISSAHPPRLRLPVFGSHAIGTRRTISRRRSMSGSARRSLPSRCSRSKANTASCAPADRQPRCKPRTQLGIDGRRATRNPLQGRRDRLEARGPIGAAAAIQTHLSTVLDHLQAVAIQLRLVRIAGGRRLGRDGTAGRYETGVGHARIVGGDSLVRRRYANRNERKQEGKR